MVEEKERDGRERKSEGGVERETVREGKGPSHVVRVPTRSHMQP